MTKLLKRIIIINQRRTSMRLCQEEWNALDEHLPHRKNQSEHAYRAAGKYSRPQTRPDLSDAAVYADVLP